MNSEVFTEDGIPVYNIFAYKIPRTVTQEEALKYFAQFGEVLNVHLVDKKRPNGSTEVFINFLDPSSAARVLQKTDHQLQSKDIFVKACDSWNQPDAQSAMHGDNKAWPLSLHALNDDCLGHIFKLLDLSDRLHLSRVCLRLRSVFQMTCSVEYRTFDLCKLVSLTIWDTREFFEIMGATIQMLIGSFPQKYRERILVYINKFCPIVHVISLYAGSVKSSCVLKFLPQMKSCAVLELKDSIFSDELLLAIKKMPKLECLSLSDNLNLTGKHLDKLTNIKILNLSGCQMIKSTHFVRMCKSVKKLKSLDVNGCNRLNAAALTHCQKLEVLKTSCKKKFITRFPCLKSLELFAGITNNCYCCNFKMPFPQEEYLAALVEHTPNLEYLTINAKNFITYECATLLARLTKLKLLSCADNKTLDDKCLLKFGGLESLEEIVISKCPAITNEGLLILLRKCTKLRRINVQFCQNITNPFVIAANELLNERRKQLPLLMLVAYTGIDENINWIRTTSPLKLSFERSPHNGHDYVDDGGTDLRPQVIARLEEVQASLYRFLLGNDDENDEDVDNICTVN